MFVWGKSKISEIAFPSSRAEVGYLAAKWYLKWKDLKNSIESDTK